MNPHTLTLITTCQDFYRYHTERGNTRRAVHWLIVYAALIAAHAVEIDTACEAVWNE